MQGALRVTFRSGSPTTAVDAQIRRKAAKLDLFRPNVLGCHVIVDEPHRHHRKGKLWSVRVDVAVPGGQIVTSHEREVPSHEDIHVAIRDAFDAAFRRLEHHVRRQHRPDEMAP